MWSLFFKQMNRRRFDAGRFGAVGAAARMLRLGRSDIERGIVARDVGGFTWWEDCPLSADAQQLIRMEQG